MRHIARRGPHNDRAIGMCATCSYEYVESIYNVSARLVSTVQEHEIVTKQQNRTLTTEVCGDKSACYYVARRQSRALLFIGELLFVIRL